MGMFDDHVEDAPEEDAADLKIIQMAEAFSSLREEIRELEDKLSVSKEIEKKQKSEIQMLDSSVKLKKEEIVELEDLRRESRRKAREYERNISDLESDLKEANARKEDDEKNAKMDDLRAVAVHIWRASNKPCSRVVLWKALEKIDNKLFNNRYGEKAIKKAVDRVNKAYQSRYGTGIEWG